MHHDHPQKGFRREAEKGRKYDYTLALKNRYMRNAPPISKVIWDNKIKVMKHAQVRQLMHHDHPQKGFRREAEKGRNTDFGLGLQVPEGQGRNPYFDLFPPRAGTLSADDRGA
jgi:hypothetical protein